MYRIGFDTSRMKDIEDLEALLDLEPADVFKLYLDEFYTEYLALLTAEQAAQAKSHPVVRKIHSSSRQPH